VAIDYFNVLFQSPTEGLKKMKITYTG